MQPPATLALLRTQAGACALRVRMARGFFGRLRGLMFAPPLPPHTGLLIPRCASVHTCFMRQALDLLYLDADGRVTQCVAHLKPWRMSAAGLGGRTGGRRTRHVLELPAGSIARLDIRPDDRLLHPLLGGSAR